MCIYINSGAVVVECDDGGCLWWRLQRQLASNKLKQTDIATNPPFVGLIVSSHQSHAGGFHTCINSW